MKNGCIITGVAGFLGSRLAERLLAMGRAVAGVDNFFSGKRENMASFQDHPAFTFLEADIRDAGTLARSAEKLPGPVCCFHFAGVSSPHYSMDHAEETMEVNHEASLSLLAESRRMDMLFVFAGSAAEYGDDARTPLREDYATERTRHPSPYGRSKLLASLEIGTDTHGVVLRFFNIYGPGQNRGCGVVSGFLDAAARGKDLTVFGDGLQTRDFLHISDAVDACLRAAGISGGKIAPPGIYNIATGRSSTVLEVAETVRILFENRPAIRFLPERAGDIRHSPAAVEKFRNVAGWSAAVSLNDGLRETMKRLGSPASVSICPP